MTENLTKACHSAGFLKSDLMELLDTENRAEYEVLGRANALEAELKAQLCNKRRIE